jgi:8-oxo-dGTP pyrophosphatase MutT (NUDIX family)
MESCSDATGDLPNVRRRGVVAVITRNDKFLVIRRSPRVVAPLAYCFPGGGIEVGESEPAALIREIKEELSVQVKPLHCIWRSATSFGVDLSWWRAELPHDAMPNPLPAEVESVHWCTLDEMSLLSDLLESNRRFVAALARGEFSLDFRDRSTRDCL